MMSVAEQNDVVVVSSVVVGLLLFLSALSVVLTSPGYFCEFFFYSRAEISIFDNLHKCFLNWNNAISPH